MIVPRHAALTLTMLLATASAAPLSAQDGAAPAQNPTGPSAQGDVSVTIYNDNLALVQDVRQLNIAGGTSRIEFPDVSAQIRPETLSFAASALGLGYWKSMGLIILPQALKHSIPGIVNNFISLFKDTSLVSIVGIFDLLNTVQSASSDNDWASPTRSVTGYLFAAMVFWVFCFAMSRYSMWIEQRMNTGYKR